MDVPKNANAYRRSISALKKDAELTKTSLESLNTSFSKLNNTQTANIIANKASVASTKNLTAESLQAMMGIQSLDVKQRNRINTILEDIAATKQNIQTLKEDTANKKQNIQKIREQTAALKEQKGQLVKEINSANPAGEKIGKSLGSTIATTAVTTLLNVMSSYSSAKQAQSVGEAWGSSVANGVSSALMTGLTVGMATGTPLIGLIAGIGSLAVTGISGLVGYNAGETQRVINTANEVTEAFKTQQSAIQSNGEAIQSISADYERLAKGVSDQGKNISLSIDEYSKYNQIVNQIASMFPQMIAGYTDEGNAILLHKGNVESLTQAYIEQKQAAQDAVLIGASDVWKGFTAATGKSGATKASLNEEKQFLEYLIAEKRTYEEILDVVNSGELIDSGQLKNLVKSMGIKTNFWTDTYTDHIKRLADPKNYSKIASYARQTMASLNAETAKIKPILSAFLETDFNYLKLDTDVQNSIKTIIGTFDGSFFKQFKTETEMYDWIDSNLIQPLQDPNNAKRFQDAWDVLLNPEIKELSASDYATQIQQAIDVIKSVFDLSDEDVINIRTKLNLEIDQSTIDNLVSRIPEYITSDLPDNIALATSFSFPELQTLVNLTEEDFAKMGNTIESVKHGLADFQKAQIPFKSLAELVAGIKDDLTLLEVVEKNLFENIGELSGEEETELLKQLEKLDYRLPKVNSALRGVAA